MNGKVKSAPEKAEHLNFASPLFDGDEYSKTARLARLQEIRLISCNYSVNLKCFMDAEASDKPMRQGFSGEVSGHHFDQSDGLLVGGYSWSAEVRFGRKKALAIRAEYFLVYSGLSEAKPDYARLYFQKIARFTSYPFFRAHFAVQTSASSLSLAPLPSLIERVD